MELEKLEDVQGLRFQHALILEPEVPEDGAGSWGTLVVSKYNLLVRYWGTRIDLHNIGSVIDRKRPDKKSLVMQLELPDEIVCVESPTNTDPDQQLTDRSLSSDKSSPRSSKDLGAAGPQSPSEIDDLLLIQTVGTVHVYSLKTRAFLHTYDKPEPKDGGPNRIWMRTTSWKGAPVLLLVNSRGSLVITDLHAKKLTVEKKLGQSIRLASNVDAQRLLIVSTANKVCLVTLEKGASRDWLVDLVELNLVSSEPSVKQAVEGAYSVVGCRLDAGLVLLALLSPDLMDNLVLMCKLGGVVSAGTSVSSLKSFFSRKGRGGPDSARSDGRSMELLVRAHCLNELFLLVEPPAEDQPSDPPPQEQPEPSLTGHSGVFVGFKYVEPWDLYVVFSNRCTATLLIAGNARLLELNNAGFAHEQGSSEPEPALKTLAELDRLNYRVLLMAEGYALESNDFDAFVADVFVYPNYHNEIYRKFSLEDTPTLRDPVVVGLLLSTGSVCFFYADRHLLDSENREVEALCPLYAGERDLYLIPAVSASPEADLSELFKPPTRADAEPAGAEQHRRDLETVLRVLRSDGPQDLVDLYYRTGRAHYRSDKRLFRLHEALANSFDVFERSLSRVDGGKPTTSRTTNTKPTTSSEKLDQYLVIIRKLLSIQRSLQSEIVPASSGSGAGDSGALSLSDIQTPEPERADTDPDRGPAELLASMHALLEGLSVGRVESVSPAELAEVESALLCVSESLSALSTRFSDLERRLASAHTRLLSHHLASDSGVDPNFASTGPILNGTSGSSSKINGFGSGAHHPNKNHPTTASTRNKTRPTKNQSACDLVEAKLNALVAEVVALHSRPLLDPNAARAPDFSGPPKLRYNEYKALFASIPAPSPTLGRPNTAEKPAPVTTSTVAPLSVPTRLGQGVGQTTSQIGPGQPSQSPFTTSERPTEKPSSPPAAVSTSLFGAPSDGADSGGRVKFGVGTSLLTGYGLGQTGALGSTSGQAALGSGSSQGAGSLSGGAPTGSVFASFSSNKSLLDIALNSSTTGGLFGGGATTGSGLFGSSGLPTAAAPSTGTFTGMGNFAANSFPTSSSMFAGLSPPASSSTTLPGGLGSSGPHNQPPQLSADLWGASRRSDPLD